MLGRYAEISRPDLPSSLVIDAVVFVLGWFAWGQHGKAMGIPLVGVAVVLMILGGTIAGSGVEYGVRTGAGGGGGASPIAGRQIREQMGSNREWSRAQRGHRQSVNPTAHALSLASLLPLVVGLAIWALGL